MPQHMDVDERAYARALHDVDPTLGPTAIADKVGEFRAKRAHAAQPQGRAKTERPSPSAISRLLSFESFIGREMPTGRKRLASEAELAALPGVVAKLEAKYPFDDVGRELIQRNWKTAMPVKPRTVGNYLHGMDRGWKRGLKKQSITKENKASATTYATKLAPKSKVFWLDEVLAIDGKGYTWQSTKKGRTKARMMQKRGSYRLAKEGRKFAVPSRLKHRQGGKSFQILCGIGAGKVRIWEEVPSWNGAEYERLVQDFIAPVVNSDERALYLLRDNDPKSFGSRKGMKAEKESGVKLVANQGLPVYRSDLSPPDFFFWKEVDRRMCKTENAWPADRPHEKLSEYKARLKKTARAVPGSVIDKGMADMQRRLRDVKDSKGEWVKGD